jgi:5-methyltetrahydropteroyltriglutamate--homocysteine methyltransferase
MSSEQTFSTSPVARVRVDQVGRLLRAQKLKEVYARHGRGEASDEELRELQDQAIRQLLDQQEAHHMPILTDGEYRRLNFQDSFVESVSGFIPQRQTMEFQQRRTLGGEALQRWQPDSARTDPQLQYWRPIVERLQLVENRPLAEWRFTTNFTKSPVKITLISPDRICENFDHQNSDSVYVDAD